MRPARERHASTWMNDYEASLLSGLYGDKPESYEEAIQGPNGVQWENAMREEYKSEKWLTGQVIKI
jgi:hypothetical protein